MYQSDRRLFVAHLPKAYLLTHPSKVLLFPLIRKVYPYTLLRYAALCQMYDISADLMRRGIAGSMVELGSWQGGCGAFFARVSGDRGDTRPIWLFDSFEGLSEPKMQDRAGSTKDLSNIKKGYLTVSPESVHEVVRLVAPKEQKRVHVIKGWFEESVPPCKKEIGPIALLRLDADLYEPTLYGLRELYDHVVPGGYVVIDDYRNLVGARKALFQFFYEKDISPYVKEYPGGGVAYFIKQ